jgi:hypothetical protein
MDGMFFFLTNLSINVSCLFFRIQIGDQIIEVDDHSLVGVTHTHATSVLKATSGLVR